MGQAVVVLKKGEGRTLKAGGMWVYDNEIASVTGSYEDEIGRASCRERV